MSGMGEMKILKMVSRQRLGISSDFIPPGSVIPTWTLSPGIVARWCQGHWQPGTIRLVQFFFLAIGITHISVVQLQNGHDKNDDFPLTIGGFPGVAPNLKSPTPLVGTTHQMWVHFGTFSLYIGVSSSFDLEATCSSYLRDVCKVCANGAIVHEKHR